MLSSSLVPPRKAKISLADYPFHRDIEVRLLMAHLSITEIEVLREIIHHSLTISIEQLAEDLGIQVKVLLPILDKLNAIKLFKRQHMTLIVDKEMRKYFENKVEKFDEDFRPDFDFLQSILNKVPIHVLPLWYAIPRSSDNIFGSIIEKYFLTPKIYLQYLSELQFDNLILEAIIQEVYQSPDFMITADELMAKFDLTHECLEEHLLLLEYHFVCCLSYQRLENRWQEIITPFAEWREYLQFECQTKAQTVPQDSVEKHQQTEFEFIKDLTIVLQACQSKKILPKNVKNLVCSPFQYQILVNKLLQLEFAKQNATGQMIATERGKTWLLKPLFEQIAALANDPLNTLTSNIKEFSSLWNIRNLRLIEKSLRRLTPHEWVEFHHFLRGLTAPIGDKEPVTLKNKGKKWKYVLPTYTDQEKLFIQAVITERLTELGIIETGFARGNLCFCLTPFGHHFIQ